MWIDIAAVIATLVLAAVGFRRGALAAVLQVLILGLAYAAAFFLGPLLAPRVAAALGSDELMGLAVAGVGVGGATYAVLALGEFLYQRREGARRYGRSLGDRLGGAAFGVAQGALVALLLGVLASWLDAGRSVGQLEGIPDLGPTQVSRFSRAVIETAISPAISTGDAPARVAMHLAARPGETLRAGQQLLDRPEILALRNDAEFWAAVDAGDIERAMQSRALLAICDSRELRVQLADLGMADRRGVEDAAFFRQEMRMMLQQLAPRLHALRHDPELAALAADPELMKAIQEKNTAALLTHPGVRRLAQRVLKSPAEPAPGQ